MNRYDVGHICVYIDRIRWASVFMSVKLHIHQVLPECPWSLLFDVFLSIKYKKLARQRATKSIFSSFLSPKTEVKIFHKTVTIRGIEFLLKYLRDGSSLASGFLYLLIHGSSLSPIAQEQETGIRKGRQQKRERERDVCICQREGD